MTAPILGIIAGAGRTPRILVEHCLHKGIPFALCGIAGVVDSDFLNCYRGESIPLGQAGKLIQFLKSQSVSDLVLTGALQRPDWNKIQVDARGLKFLAHVLVKKTLGDDALLRLVRAELESEGFRVRGIQDYAPELLAPEGSLSAIHPSHKDYESVKLGWNTAHFHGQQDKGQSVVVQGESVIGFEDKFGTDALIKKVIPFPDQRGPILVKVCKPQQDRDLDLPTIGPQTVRQCAAKGFVGIAIEAGTTLIVDREEVVELCNEHNLFLLSLSYQSI